ncbi:MAG: hypothetical protein NTW45_05615 [Rhodocyclales bacterium]|nr:hypothetical protein [Rhodocyclales bacterium]
MTLRLEQTGFAKVGAGDTAIFASYSALWKAFHKAEDHPYSP